MQKAGKMPGQDGEGDEEGREDHLTLGKKTGQGCCWTALTAGNLGLLGRGNQMQEPGADKGGRSRGA